MSVRAFVVAFVLLVACGGHVDVSAPAPTLGPSGLAAGIRLLAPLSTSTVTSQRPTLHWVIGEGNDGAEIDLCRDRACTATIATFDVQGSHGTPPNALAPGVYFWRARATKNGVAGTVSTPVWELLVGAENAPVDTSWGTTLDVNGDGFPDLAVGTSGIPAGTGHAYVYLGSATGFATTPSTTLAGPTGGFGYRVSSAGDINGDGFGDLVVGARRFETSDLLAHVYLGGPTGISATPSAVITNPDTADDFVSAAGDVNGDGFGDLIVGESDPMAARARIYFGSADGISPTATTQLGDLPGNEVMGAVVASAGDVNGDGFGDVILMIAAPQMNGVGGRPAYLYLGSASGPSATPMKLTDFQENGIEFDSTALPPGVGDFDGDGYADIVFYRDSVGLVFRGGSAGPTTKPNLMITDVRGSTFTPMAGADVNGDGFDDLLIGSESPVEGVNGAVYVYLGSAAGVPTTATTILTGPDQGFGFFVANAGDVDGDGFVDVIVADTLLLSPGVGSASVYRGGAAGLASAPTTTLTCPDPNDTFAVTAI